jgi:hypothetical protein
LHLVVYDSLALSTEQARDMWRHVDHVLDRYHVSPPERARIECAIALKVPGPGPTATMTFLAAAPWMLRLGRTTP